LGGSGQVAWIFEPTGVIKISDKTKEDQVMEVAVELGADDVKVESDGIVISCEPAKVHKLRDEIEKKLQLVCASCELLMIPKNTVPVDEETEEGQAVALFIDALENHDDVQNVYHNAVLEEKQ